MASSELPAEVTVVAHPNDVAHVRFEIKWADVDAELSGWQLLSEYRPTIDAAIRAAVGDYLGAEVAVRSVSMSRGSVIVTVVLTALAAIAKYKAFVDGLTLLISHIRGVLQDLVDRGGQSVAVNATWVPGPMLGSTRKPRTIQRLFLWCAGCDVDALARCQRSERIKHAGFGSLVLIPAVLGFASMAYAASTFTSKAYEYRLIGIVWAIIIFAIDRFIVSTFRKGKDTRSDFKSSSFVARFGLSLLLGVVVSHPLLLWVFRGSIDDVIAQRQRANTVVVHQPFNDAIDRRQKELDSLRQAIPALDKTFQAHEQALQDMLRRGTNGDAVERMERLRAQAVSERNGQLTRVNVRMKNLNDEISDIQKRRTAEPVPKEPSDYLVSVAKRLKMACLWPPALSATSLAASEAE